MTREDFLVGKFFTHLTKESANIISYDVKNNRIGYTGVLNNFYATVTEVREQDFLAVIYVFNQRVIINWRFDECLLVTQSK